MGSLRTSYREGSADPRTVIGEVLARCDGALADGTLLSVIDRAAAEAEVGALLRRRGDAGSDPFAALPLYGVPVVVKDNVDVAGLPTTAGCEAYAYRPERSAPAVQRLEEAGAIVVAKANMDQFATGLVGVRSETPPPNALDPALVPGGSSSGSAVAVARGLVTLAVGTDTAGSGRVPAAMNGVFGWKAPPGRVSNDGVVPASWTLDCVSVFAADLAGALVAGRLLDPAGPWRPVSPGRVGVLDQVGLGGCAPGVVDGMRWVADRLDPTVAVVAVDSGALFAVGDLLYEGPWLAERTAAVGDFIAAHRRDVNPVVADIILAGDRWSAVDVYRSERTRRRLVRGPLEELWRRVDVLVVPTVPWLATLEEVAADPVDVNRHLGRFTNFANLLGLAAIAVPVPSAPRSHPAVPLGVTLLAPAGREGMLVALAELLTGEPDGALDQPAPTPGDVRARVELVVAGAHMTGFPLERQLLERDAVLVRRTSTDVHYRFHHLAARPPDRPALERVESGGRAIEVEVWSIPLARLGELMTLVAPPLAIGSVRLADGEERLGFVCESGGLAGAVDITGHGGWRSYTSGTDGDRGHPVATTGEGST
nr:allophanate hydrolase [Rhabdothermincola salaria]